jgi:renalase
VSEPQVIVIGAGVAGLHCARELTRRRIRTIVLERARGVGGRCATRRILGDQPVDHGVPFLHGTTAAFFAVLDEIEHDGRIERWPDRVRGPRYACQPDAFQHGQFRLAHADGVNVFPKILARGLDVHRGHDVATLSDAGGTVRVNLKDGDTQTAPIVVVATHAPQAWALVSSCVDRWPGAPPGLDAMAVVEAIPALTVIAAYEPGTPEPPFDIWYPAESTLLHTVSHDSTKRRAAAHRVLVYQARPGFSREYLEADADDWQAEILREAADLLGPWAGEPAWRQAHRWRAARVRPMDTQGKAPWFESPAGARIGVIGDAWSHRGGLEGAFESAHAMAEHIAGIPGVAPPA